MRTSAVSSQPSAKAPADGAPTFIGVACLCVRLFESGLRFREWGAEENAIAALIVDDVEAFGARYVRSLRCAEQEACG